MPSFVARLITDETAARHLAAAIDDPIGGDAVCSAFEGDGGQWHVALHFGAAPDETAVRSLVARVAGAAAANALIFEQVADADWVTQSLAGLKPVRAGRFIVHGAHDRAHIPANAVAIEIEAALAFGTGHHGTTRGCLLAIDALAKRRRQAPIPLLKGEGRPERSEDRDGVNSKGRDLHPARSARHPPPCRGRDKRVLDIGTGSGVLAIAAAKIFRKPVVASDIDRQAVAAARGNARLNRAGTFITHLCATGTMARLVTQHAPYDLIVANILLGPLTRLAVPLARLSRPGGHIVLSGLLSAQANAALAIYRAQGLALEHRIPLAGWVTLVLTKKRNRPGRGRPERPRRLKLR